VKARQSRRHDVVLTPELHLLGHRHHRDREVKASPTGFTALHELARTLQVQTGYRDMSGRWQTAPPECLRGILEALGSAAGTERECRDSLRELELQTWRVGLDPAILAWDGRGAEARIRSPIDLPDQSASLKLILEDGTTRSLEWRPSHCRIRRRAEIEGRGFVERQFGLPALPLGYHRLELEIRHRVHRALVISAPSKAYSPPSEKRSWGLFLPMYAAHSASSWGAGDLRDYAKLCSWTKSLGGEVIATLPLLAAFLKAPVCEPSPYSPASRLFWNEFFIQLEAVPEFAGCQAARKLAATPGFRRRLADFRNASRIDYGAEMAARRSVLELLADRFFGSTSRRHREYEEFLSAHLGVEDYAEFRATCDRRSEPWRRWDERMRHGKLQAGDYSERVKNYYLYSQWIVQDQVATLLDEWQRQGGRFHLDLPLGVHPDGYDVWRRRDAFASSVAVGAPPDMFFTKGQNWGFPPLHPRQIREQGYSYVLEYLRFQMRHTGLLRIDHVMGLHRLYWIPPGFPAHQGAYVQYPAEELLALICLESERNKTVIIGENLGTVPPEVTAAMVRHGLRETYVAQYAHQASRTQPLRSPPKQSVAMLNTHDLPTFAAHWRGADIQDRARRKLISEREARRAMVERAAKAEALKRFLQREGWLESGPADEAAVMRACLAWLAAGPAETLLINLEDLWGEECPQNMPGLVNGSNWRRKARFTVEEIQNSPGLSTFLRAIGRWRKAALKERRKSIRSR